MQHPQPAPTAAYDEMVDARGEVRPHYQAFSQWLAQQPADAMAARQIEADLSFRRVGITFSVAGDAAGTERLIPFDLVPRIIPVDECTRLDAGQKQRVRALTLYDYDILHGNHHRRAGE